VLVYHDVMGLAGDFRPKFVRKYADLSAVIRDAAGAFVRDVKSGGFPSKEESFHGREAAAAARALRRAASGPS
jgi:3-methyl-2-oxobutanoate hydroxymethyltransferase